MAENEKIILYAIQEKVMIEGEYDTIPVDMVIAIFISKNYAEQYIKQHQYQKNIFENDELVYQDMLSIKEFVLDNFDTYTYNEIQKLNSIK